MAAGSAILLSAAHVLITHSGGYAAPQAILTIAIAFGVICTALIIGAAWAAERRALAVLLALFVIAGEAYGLLGTAERLVAQREEAQVPVRAAQESYRRASQRVTDAEMVRGAITPTSDRLMAALAAKSAADAAVVERAAERSCAANCRALLQAQVDSASIEIEASRHEIVDRIRQADTQLAAARAEFAAMEAPRSPSPFADRVGVPAWLIDLVVAVLGALGANGLGIGLIAYAAHGRSFDASETAAAMPDAEHAAQFMLEAMRPAPEQAADLIAVFRTYKTWCERRKARPLSEAQFGGALATVFDHAGVPIIERDGRYYARGIEIADGGNLLPAG